MSNAKADENGEIMPIQANKPVKKRRNRPDLVNFGAETAQPGDVSKRVRAMKEALKQMPIDTSNPDAVLRRIWEYLDYCELEDVKPEIISLSLWLGVSRDTLNSWKRGEYRKESHSDIIKRVVIAMEALTVGLALDGKAMPGSVIFILKNHFGYTDNVTISTQNVGKLDEMESAEDIADKYAKLPEFSEYLTDSE